jgi:hypothetical protein
MPVKATFRPSDTPGMSKRALLWMLGLIALGFCYIAAVNVKEVSVHSVPSYLAGGGTYVSTSCKGMWWLGGWFSKYCSDSLPSRLGVIALGVAVLILCGYFAEKGKQPPLLIGGHDVRRDPLSMYYICRSDGCGFISTSRDATRLHRVETGAALGEGLATRPAAAATASAPSAWYWFSDLDQPSASRPATPEARSEQTSELTPEPEPTSEPKQTPEPEPKPEPKTCPDCAEEVRFAARKCRFCGYMFAESAKVSG